MAGTVTMITGVSSWRKGNKIKGALQGGGSTTRYNNSVIRENEANTWPFTMYQYWSILSQVVQEYEQEELADNLEDERGITMQK